jgi:hypothetical protein
MFTLQQFVLVYFHCLNIQDMDCYTGEQAAERAAADFEFYTGISYAEYTLRRLYGEEVSDILSEDDEGTEIYVVQPIATGQKEKKTSTPLWLYEE